jgi:hypothetical protein
MASNAFREAQEALGQRLTSGEYLVLPKGIAGLAGRHPGTRHFGPLFAFGHLPEGLVQDACEVLAEVAAAAIAALPDGPELSAGLRKLLEAKDCLGRAAVLAVPSLPVQPTV